MESVDYLMLYFNYHPPLPEQIPLYAKLRNGALEFAKIVIDCCPEGDDKQEAIRLIRHAVMIANASIACEGE